MEKINAEFLRAQQQLEQEFNQKRAKFKELYLAKEGKFASLFPNSPAKTVLYVKFSDSTVFVCD